MTTSQPAVCSSWKSLRSTGSGTSAHQARISFFLRATWPRCWRCWCLGRGTVCCPEMLDCFAQKCYNVVHFKHCSTKFESVTGTMYTSVSCCARHNIALTVCRLSQTADSIADSDRQKNIKCSRQTRWPTWQVCGLVAEDILFVWWSTSDLVVAWSSSCYDAVLRRLDNTPPASLSLPELHPCCYIGTSSHSSILCINISTWCVGTMACAVQIMTHICHSMLKWVKTLFNMCTVTPLDLAIYSKIPHSLFCE